jgi:DNA-binding LytR/AlgR family response regulator
VPATFAIHVTHSQSQTTMNTQALIAEDEPVLARGLARALSQLWPELTLCAVVHDGEAAIEAAQAHRPSVLFLDIQMPGQDGLEAAESIVDLWPRDEPLPLIVFVTAFDRFAIAAFEQSAVDDVLKPVKPERLALTCERLKLRLRERSNELESAALAPLHALQQAHHSATPLHMIPASVGNTLHMVPTSDIAYFQADGKYVRVVSHEREWLIRTPLRELAPKLDRSQFTQIHRGTVVRTALIDRVVRHETGKISLHLKTRKESLAVSRSYAHLFRPM